MNRFRIPGPLGVTTANSTPVGFGIRFFPATSLSFLDLQWLAPLPPGPIGTTTQPPAPKKTRPANVETFIALILPSAQKVKTAWDVPIAICLAQAALETGWGKSVKDNAYFGIKGKSPSGASTTFTTTEYTDSKTKITIQDTFRAYKDLDEAADDYGRFLKTNPRYSKCFSYSNDSLRFADALQAAGYATDPQYSPKLKNIIQSYELYLFDGPTEILYSSRR